MGDKKKLGQCVGLHAQTKQIIIKIYHYFKREAEMGTIPNLKQVQKRVCEAIGIGRTTVTELISKERSRLHEKIVREMGFKGSVSSCRRVIRRLGFRWRRSKDNRKILIERHDIRSKRLKYLREIRQYREEGRPIVYVDETYIHSTHTSSIARLGR